MTSRGTSTGVAPPRTTGPASGELVWSVVISIRDSAWSREYTITEGQLRRWRRVVAALVLLVILAFAGLLVTLPRSFAYDGLIQENLALKSRLQEIDRKMSEVDRILLRLRLYDAQLESLSGPRGDHGPTSAPPVGAPMPDRLFANARLDLEMDETWLHGSHAFEGYEDPEIWLDDDPAVLLDPSWTPDMRPAEAWAMAVHARADTFLTLFTRAEPNLHLLMEELEGLRALEAALPSLWPANGRFTSGYGWRKHPLGNTWRFHSGVDVAGSRGTPIYAAGPGTVVKAYYSQGYGRMVEIDHGYGITSLYAHCHTLNVRKGDVVQRGDLIGTIGSTGRSTGPHLHFEVRLDGHAVDPMDYLAR